MNSTAASSSSSNGQRFPAFFRSALHLLFPQTCAVCRQDIQGTETAHGLCPTCYDRFPVWAGLVCQCCGVPLPDGGEHCYHCRREKRSFSFSRSAGLYEGSLKECLRLFKYSGKDYLARPLGRFMSKTLLTIPGHDEISAIVPVPLHFIKRRLRGYNQAERLARVLSEGGIAPVCSDRLKRRKHTPSQTRLNRDERKRNMSDAFLSRPWPASLGARVLLVDDVCTTGATLDSCAHALIEAGVKSVIALTVARQL